jgi:hypothetical protein
MVQRASTMRPIAPTGRNGFTLTIRRGILPTHPNIRLPKPKFYSVNRYEKIELVVPHHYRLETRHGLSAHM